MKLQPVRGYRGPRYPTHAILQAHPELLRLVPRRWRRNAVVLAAVAGAAALVYGCQKAAVPAGPSVVAPLFVHGQGQGSFGCKVITPPVFLSEDEAKAVIREEAAKAGVLFANDCRPALHIGLPVTDPNFDRSPVAHRRRGRFQLDGADAKRGISFAYVSTDDFEAWQKRQPQATVYRQDTKAAAVALRESLVEARPTGHVAVFYDPMAQSGGGPPGGMKDFSAWQGRQQAASEHLARQQLREQVRDFLRWLKAQGVI